MLGYKMEKFDEDDEIKGHVVGTKKSTIGMLVHYLLKNDINPDEVQISIQHDENNSFTPKNVRIKKINGGVVAIFVPLSNEEIEEFNSQKDGEKNVH